MASSMSTIITCPPAFIKAANVSSRVRIMSAGKCTGKFGSARIKLDCPCAKGLFPLYRQKILGDECTECGHSLADHEDNVSNENLGPLPTDNIQQKVEENKVICPRQDTVTKLIDLIESYPIVHIRGTPASGKTTLSQLLRDSLIKQGKRVFLLPFWTPLENFNSARPEAWTALHNMLTQKFSDPSISDYLGEESVLIVDEAQMSYGDMFFWNGIIKERSDGLIKHKIRICLFCSFGSPSTGVDDVIYTPHRIFPEQRVTITPQPDPDSPQIGLFYTETEFSDVISRLAQHRFTEIFTLDDEAKSYLFSLTNGHPGGLESMMAYIYYVYRHRMKREEVFLITEQAIIDGVERDEDSTFQFLLKCSVARSFPPESLLTPESADVLSTIAENGSISWTKRPGLETCYRNGWVHRMPVSKTHEVGSMCDIGILPSRLHEKWIEHIIGKRRNPLPTHFANLIQLCIAVLRGFSAINLKHSTDGKTMSSAAKPRPLEGQFQDEFYRVFNKLAGRGVPICTEWSRTSAGRVNFWIPEKGWAIEFLRDYDRIDEHVLRFKKGGRYYQWLEEKAVTDWIVINCATTPPSCVHSESNLIHAVYQNDYTELQIFDHRGSVLGPVTRVTN
ncbi:hypothetical protein BDW42DRAFT_172707 [Aspergillus taichungensis]|uniref:P-loop containing nucleoside triphosphate hydrolase protein n=1 Tax=Aspergillus taichungensis TaxID=482145 RepID=A0A2J5HQI5_9EURO|nr:hypothetical protein BDW42DRAFT_172707 [Aspergillus taichungensis]